VDIKEEQIIIQQSLENAISKKNPEKEAKVLIAKKRLFNGIHNSIDILLFSSLETMFEV
jgi:hypothetical protein